MTFTTLQVLAAEVHNELPMPPFMYGVVAFLLFVVFGVATWSYRDVANRHSQKTDTASSSHSDHGHGH
ncbi:hypothetical protein [Mycetocola reblochoni]|uniref:Uncharacterized protein n=2 Tax=Mycetocola reblochoni TaxID=331618 RepID=A0A1R4JDY3_9MICO|nr:hypothetical protein [Mycetocola reblochoni]RLP69918.1 hypothetical protein D9V30_04340 [Mycetocola reblochoni]SJN30222.1 hypothetical protein FM119_07045 [Mycetocola reblochoni REB411]